ncbi:MAG: RDD family protein [Candidatus Rokubacteria bacterium]|nr:RDD family protein [Candidatus Rokubacteria bacterium]
MRAASAAGFWIRAIALVVDLIVLTIVQASFDVAASVVFGVDPERTLAVSSTVSFFTLVFAALYTTVLHATGGQTLGKRLVGVRVVALDGEPPLGGAAFLRWLAYFASFATLGFGFLMAGLRSDKRALHDLLAGTRVERVPRVRRDVVRDTEAPVESPAPAARGDAETPPLTGL